MSEQHNDHGSDQHETHHVNYTKIYVVLLVLLVISVAGPHLGILWLTLITAFGVAVVKATLVVQNFMHLKWEKAIMKWMLAASLVLMALFFFGVAPDVMRHEGRGWVNDAALAAVERGFHIEEHGEGGDEHAAGSEGGEEVSDGGADAVAAAPAAFDPATAYATVCSTCHGPAGAGDGPGGAALDPKPANFTDPGFWAERDDEEIVTAILQGGAAVGRSALMPAWGSLYNEEQARELAAYLHSLSN